MDELVVHLREPGITGWRSGLRGGRKLGTILRKVPRPLIDGDISFRTLHMLKGPYLISSRGLWRSWNKKEQRVHACPFGGKFEIDKDVHLLAVVSLCTIFVALFLAISPQTSKPL